MIPRADPHLATEETLAVHPDPSNETALPSIEVLRDRVLDVARRPERFTVVAPGGSAAAITIEVLPMRPDFAEHEADDALCVNGTIDGAPYVLKIPGPPLALWIERHQPLVPWRDLDPTRRAEVIEYLLAGFVDLLETRAGQRIIASRVVEGLAIESNFGFAIEIDGIKTVAAGRFGKKTLSALVGWAARQPRRTIGGLTASVSIRRGYCHLTVGELKRLAIGDGIVFDPITPDIGLAVFGETLAAQVRFQASDAVLLDRPRDNLVGPMRHWMNNSLSHLELGLAPVEGGVGSIPIKVVFDVGRFELPLGQIESIAEGHVFHLDRVPRALVDIVAQGRVIGQGEIIQHQDLYAVRVTALTI